MRDKRELTRLLLLLGTLQGVSPALAQPGVQEGQQQRLIEQIRVGEALYRDDLVRDSLTRLESIAPDSPEALAAGIRLALRQQDQGRAETLLARLAEVAPGSPPWRQSQLLVRLGQPQGRQALQEARLLAAAGRAGEALAAYDKLLAGAPLGLELGVEYWKLRGGLAGQRPQAIERLRELDRQYPGNTALRQSLAGLLFAEARNREALQVLHQLADDPRARNAAAQREFDYFDELEPGTESVAGWQAFVDRYPDSPLRAEAAAALARQRTLLADPGWQAAQRGRRLLEQGHDAEAQAQLRQALRRFPQDGGLHGALGLAQMRLGQREAADASFRQALRLDKDSRRIDKWSDLGAANRYWLTLQQGGVALEAKRFGQARSLYGSARRQRPREVGALLGLSEVALAEGQTDEAERLLLQARQLAPDHEGALHGLYRLYLAQSPDRARVWLDSLSPEQQRGFAVQRRTLRLQQLRQAGEAARARQDWAQASASLQQAVELDPDDPWLTYHLAGSLSEQRRHGEAGAVFERLLQRQGRNPQARHAHGLYLAASERDASALSSLEAIPQAQWSDDMRALAARLQRRYLLARIEALQAAGQEREAIALLQAQAADRPLLVEGLLRLADRARQGDDHARALDLYRQVLTRDPAHAEARLGQIESWLELGETARARRALEQAPPAFPAAEIGARRRLGNAWAAVGERQRGSALLEQLAGEQQAPDSLLHRDRARLLASIEPQRALDAYARAMGDAGLLTSGQASPRDDRALTLASREQDEDDWLRRSLRSDVDELYRRQNPTLRLQHDHAWREDSTTPGLSDLETDTSIAQIDWPLAGGQAFLRAERVRMDAGSFDTDADGRHTEEFGTCSFQGRDSAGRYQALPGCPGGSQTDSGTAVAMGWRNERLAVDFGRSPQGFEVDNWLGGVTYDWDFAGLGWSLTASRRPLTNSLLSYAGSVDPRTGIRWGGVTANGVSLGLSHDRGGRHGVWSQFGKHWLHGKNVADNERTTVMAGYYYKLIDRADTRMRLGLTGMYWHYDKDLGDYSLGQGGYYSPQHYYSLGVPASYAWRNSDWSVLLEGALGWSYAVIDDSERYPLQRLVARPLAEIMAQSEPAAFGQENFRQDGGRSDALSYRAQALVERRLSDHLVLGGGFTLQHSRDYAPQRVSLYLRYTFEPWQGNLSLVPSPLIPYGDFR